MRLSVYLGENEIRTVLGRSGKKIEIMDCLSTVSYTHLRAHET